jgi:hypothetical protein
MEDQHDLNNVKDMELLTHEMVVKLGLPEKGAN